jgi:phosphoribosylamine-glycine ligase
LTLDDEVFILSALKKAPSARREFRGSSPTVMVLGVGSFAHSMMRILKEDGTKVVCYLTRPYGHYGASLEGPVYDSAKHPSPVPLIRKHKVGLVVPMSIDWAQKPWAEELLRTGARIFCPTGEGLKLERERDLARVLCERFGIPFPRSYFAGSLKEAKRIVERDPRAYVIKNPLCSPTSPIHTIVCEDVGDTLNWLPRLDFSEGVFLQEYLGRAEAGHFAFVANGEVRSIATNQEYKRAFHGNQGVVAGAPLGGLVQRDLDDQYGLGKALLYPLREWFAETGFSGPVQVTGIYHRKRWHVLEYNVRLGVTSGAIFLRMMKNPVKVLMEVASGKIPRIEWRKGLGFGCSVTLAGYGYPYTKISGPELPVKVTGKINCDLWWNEVRKEGKQLLATGHRIADVVGIGQDKKSAIELAMSNIKKLSSLASYYREDVGQSLWPPGTV